MTEKNYFTELNSINVSDKIDKKANLSYLSWAWAWEQLKRKHPDANYKIYEREDGCFYWTDGKTCWVKTGVIVNSIEHIEYLPVMDYRNKSISADSITSVDVNKSIQRSLTKAIARHGLGLYIYAGEDLPEAPVESISTPKKIVTKTPESFGKAYDNYSIDISQAKNKDDITKIMGRVKESECNNAEKVKLRDMATIKFHELGE